MRKYVHAERMRAAYLQYHGARAEASMLPVFHCSLDSLAASMLQSTNEA